MFAALADPTRRAILARLADGDHTVGELTARVRRTDGEGQPADLLGHTDEVLSASQRILVHCHAGRSRSVVIVATGDQAALTALGKFKADNLPIATLARNVAAAQMLLDRVGYR